MDTSTVETTDASVNTSEQSEAPVNAPATGEASQASDKSEGEVEVQLSPKAQQRMQKLANEAREAKKIRAEYQDFQKKAEGALAIDRWLRADQRRAEKFTQWMREQENPQAQENPYAKYNPEIQELAKTSKELSEWKANQEQRELQAQQSYLEQNQSKLEEHFEGLLKSEGFTDEKGAIDEGLSNALAEAVLARLAKTVEDPRYANEKQVTEAFKGVVKDLSALEKRALKQVVKQPGVAASGSGTGKVASQKIDFSNQDNRIAALMAGMKG